MQRVQSGAIYFQTKRSIDRQQNSVGFQTAAGASDRRSERPTPVSESRRARQASVMAPASAPELHRQGLRGDRDASFSPESSASGSGQITVSDFDLHSQTRTVATRTTLSHAKPRLVLTNPSSVVLGSSQARARRVQEQRAQRLPSEEEIKYLLLTDQSDSRLQDLITCLAETGSFDNVREATSHIVSIARSVAPEEVSRVFKIGFDLYCGKI